MEDRDQFAIAALGAIGIDVPGGDMPPAASPEERRLRRARWCYAMADAMLAVRLEAPDTLKGF